MEIDIHILRLKRPALADDLEKLAAWRHPEIRLFNAAYEGIRRAMKAGTKEELTFRGMRLIQGGRQRASRKKRPQEMPLLPE